jgi:hypothetical protein
MIYHFNKEEIQAKDIFYGEHYDLNGKKSWHYFYCIYSQDNDKTHELFRDIIGLLITTKQPKGYYIEVNINEKIAYVCCDIEIRFFSSVDMVQNKHITLNKKEHKKIYECYNKFTKIKIKQIKKGENK